MPLASAPIGTLLFLERVSAEQWQATLMCRGMTVDLRTDNPLELVQDLAGSQPLEIAEAA